MTQAVVSREAVRRIALRRGLIYGAIIGALYILSAVGAHLIATDVFGAGSTLFPDATRYAALAAIVLSGAINLIVFVLLYMTGFSTYMRVKRIGAGALAGLVAGGLGRLANLLALSLIAYISLSTTPGYTAHLILPSVLATTVSSATLGLAWNVAEGAGLGALGALARQSIYS